MLFMLPNKVNSAHSVSFTFNKLGGDQKDLIFQGDATSNNNVLQLTKLDNKGNPVSGSQLTLLQLLEFPSSLHDSTIPPHSGGRLLGLFPDSNALKNSSSSNNETAIDFKASSDKVVAVEFDTYHNWDSWDPYYKHIGIDVNSIRSKATAQRNWQNGKIATAHISYNSASKRLTVVAFYPATKAVTLSHDIELNKVLPEWVRVGISASTGAHKQKNTILSWSFTSSLKNNGVQKKEDMYIASVA
uniref:Legume lectin domain-containing protein n=1 Tax=Glycine max TaxID=3847 RepID=A0A0R0HY71_SOYBN